MSTSSDRAAMLKQLEIVLLEDRSDQQTLRKAGVLALELGRPEVAARHFRTLLDLLPDDADACTGLAIALSTLGQHSEAIRVLSDLTKQEPPSASAYINLGRALLETGAMQSALRALQRALELRPGDPDAHLNLGVVLHMSGQYRRAVESFQSALEGAPGWSLAHHDLGISLRASGDLEGAQAAFARALGLDPRNSQIQRDMAAILADLSRGGRNEATVVARRESAFRGDLGKFKGPDLLDFLLNLRSSGTLRISSRGRELELRMRSGRLIGGTCPDSKHLREILIESEAVDKAEMKSQCDDWLATGDLSDNLLLDKQIAGPEKLNRAIQQQVDAVFRHILTLEEGSFVFDEDEVTNAIASDEIGVDGRFAMLDAMRALDEAQARKQTKED